MKTEQFLQHLAEILVASPGDLSPTRALKDFKGWDSMGQMAVLTLIDTDVAAEVPPGAIGACKTVGDIMALAQEKLEP